MNVLYIILLTTINEHEKDECIEESCVGGKRITERVLGNPKLKEGYDNHNHIKAQLYYTTSSIGPIGLTNENEECGGENINRLRNGLL